MTRSVLLAIVVAATIGVCMLIAPAVRTASSADMIAGPKPSESAVAPAPAEATPNVAIQQVGNYVIIGWNDLGMHCLSARFREMAILPPYNDLKAVVIRRGEDPRLVTTGLTVSYSLDNNKSVAGKTDFWTYAPKLFGKSLPLGIGLTGNGLSGKMKIVGDHFEATGVPVLPYNDAKVWNPYQRGTLRLSGPNGITGVTAIVVPTSDEMNCVKCHSAGAIRNIRTPTTEGNILTLHDQLNKTQLMANRPVLCASCHSDNALGAPGKAGVESLSLAMHAKHAALRTEPTCYDCHPGAKTQCNRSAIPAMGPTDGQPNCQKCHGTLDQMAAKLKLGRKPWLEEPSCAQCHGHAYTTGNTLYRKAKGHGGIYCVTCHNSPHAWWPSHRWDDNLQPKALQGSAKPLGYKKCSICHTDGRTGTMPPHVDD